MARTPTPSRSQFTCAAIQSVASSSDSGTISSPTRPRNMAAGRKRAVGVATASVMTATTITPTHMSSRSQHMSVATRTAAGSSVFATTSSPIKPRNTAAPPRKRAVGVRQRHLAKTTQTMNSLMNSSKCNRDISRPLHPTFFECLPLNLPHFD